MSDRSKEQEYLHRLLHLPDSILNLESTIWLESIKPKTDPIPDYTYSTIDKAVDDEWEKNR